MKKFIICLALTTLVLASSGTAQAQITPPSTLGYHYKPHKSPKVYNAKLTSPSTLGYHYKLAKTSKGSKTTWRPNDKPSRRAMVAIPRVNPAMKAPANMPVIGNWSITSLRNFDSFFLTIDQVSGSRIYYRTSIDSRTRLGNFNPLTGFVTFTHTDTMGVVREFTGRIHLNRKGQWELNGSFSGGSGLAASKVFFGTRAVR